VCKSIFTVIINIQFQLVIDYNVFKLKYRLRHSNSHVKVKFLSFSSKMHLVELLPNIHL